MSINFITILIISFSFLFLKISSSTFPYEITCDGDKPSTDICALKTYFTEEHEQPIVVIKKKCGKNSRCVNDENVENSDMFHCVEKIKARKIGKKCNLDGDCITNYCLDGKCTALKEGGNCKFRKCGHDYACSEAKGEKYKTCQPLQPKEYECAPDSLRCIFGYKCSDVGENPKCKKFGSVESGGDSDEPLICASGMIYNNKCVEVIQDGECKKHINDDGEAIFRCEEIEFKGADYDLNNNPLICKAYVGNKNDEANYVCPLSKVKGKVWLKYMEIYNKLDFDKINKDEKNFYDNPNGFKFRFDNPKLISTDIVFYNADQFIARGYLDNDGNIIEDHRCEVDWLISYLDSKYITLSYFLLTLSLGLII